MCLWIACKVSQNGNRYLCLVIKNVGIVSIKTAKMLFEEINYKLNIDSLGLY